MFKVNDGGRVEAGYKGATGDCVTRAIAIASGLSYQKVYDDLAELCVKYNSRKTKRARKISHPRTGVSKKVYEPYIKKIGGVWIPCMGIGTGCTVNLANFQEHHRYGKYILRLSRHLSTVVDGVIHDTYDPSREGNRCVYGYWKFIN